LGRIDEKAVNVLDKYMGNVPLKRRVEETRGDKRRGK